MKVKMYRGGRLLGELSLENGNTNNTDVAHTSCITPKKIIIPNYTDLSEENRKKVKTCIVRNYTKIWNNLKENDEKTKEEWLLLGQLTPYFTEDSSKRTNLSDEIDKKIFPNGLQNGQLYTITGISGGGKTAICIMLTAVMMSGINPFIKETVFNEKPVIYVSLEQTKAEIKARIMSSLLALNNLENDVSFGELLNNQVENIHTLILGETLYSFYKQNLLLIGIDDFEDSPTVEEIPLILKAKNFQLSPKSLMIIDQYENLTGANDFNNDCIANALKKLAINEDIPIIVQVQLTKNAISKAQKKDGKYDINTLSSVDLRCASGLVHQSSSILILLPQNKEKNIKGKNAKLVSIIQTKARYSEQGFAKMWFLGGCNLFLDAEGDDK